MNIYLLLYRVSFYDYSLKPKWYKDHASPSVLDISSGDLKIIEENAFNSDQFKSLRTLYLYQLQTIELRIGAFNGLHNLKKLILSQIGTISAHYRLLEPVAHSLYVYTIAYVYVPLPFYNLLGAIKLNEITRICLCALKIGRTITKHSITNMPRVKTIFLTKSEVEVIERDSFDHIKNTLDALVLRGNKLKTLPFDLFDRLSLFLDDDIFAGNPLQCDCNIIEIRKTFHDLFEDICSGDQSIEIEKEDDCHLKLTEMKPASKNCMEHYGTNSLRILYSKKFLIRVNYTDRIIFIKSPIRSTLYLLAFVESNPMDGVKCLKTTAKYSAISLHRIHSSTDVFMICIAETEKRVWPLNCITYRFNPMMEYELWLGENERIIIMVAFGTVSTVLFLTAVLLGTCIAKQNLILMKGINRVLIKRHRGSNKIESVLVMPAIWTNSQKVRASMPIDSDCKTSGDEFYSYVNVK